jgi:rhamnosyltransferase
MRPDEVLAVVVSYNGLQSTRQTVEALRTQVGEVYVVDNGSAPESLAVLDTLELEEGVVVERLGENRGIGHALNRGVRRARERGYPWLLTMDQDSLVDGSLVQAYATAIAEDPSRVCLSPLIPERGGRQPVETVRVAYAITSGNLVQMSVFDEIGLYDEGLFIDCVDFDFCLRLRRAGYTVQRVADARMRHQLGEAVRAPRLIRRFYALHSPVRRYYMYRNYMYLVERYLVSFPAFILKLGLAQVILTVLIAFLDPSPKRSYRAIGCGIRDYLSRREGPFVERVR